MYLGIDVGTSSVKSLLIGEDQAVVGEAKAELTVSRPHTGWSEQDPHAWWAGVGATLDALAREHPGAMRRVQGIGLSGQMHGATLLDEADEPLRPCMLWNDARAGEECRLLADREPRFVTLGGNPVMAGFTAPKVEWVRRNEPEIFEAIAKILLPKDYVRLKLSGDYGSDMSDASGTLWLDVAAREWADPLLEASGLTREQMPKLQEGTQPTGRLRAELSERWGMERPPVIAGGGGDNAATACGVGTVAPGSAFVSLGTSGVLFATNDRFSPDAERAVHAFCHALPDTWHQMGVILSAADSLEWLARQTGLSAHELAASVPERPERPSPVLFLPYLSGERTPHNDPGARGAFVGLAADHDRATLAQAAMEGVAFAFRDCLDALTDAGTSIDRVLAVGGGSNSPAWLAMIASALRIPVDVPERGDFGAAFGAARLGLIAATGTDARAICTAPPVARTVEPQPGLAAAYADRIDRWRALAPHINEALGR